MEFWGHNFQFQRFFNDFKRNRINVWENLFFYKLNFLWSDFDEQPVEPFLSARIHRPAAILLSIVHQNEWTKFWKYSITYRPVHPISDQMSNHCGSLPILSNPFFLWFCFSGITHGPEEKRMYKESHLTGLPFVKSLFSQRGWACLLLSMCNISLFLFLHNRTKKREKEI